MQKSKLFTTALMLVVCVSFTSVQAQNRADRNEKNAGMQYFKASTTEVAEYRAVSLDDGSTLYVAPQMSFAGKSVQATTVNTSNGEALQMTLSDNARHQLADATHLAIYMNNKFFGSGSINGISDDGQLTVSGLSSRQMNQITKMSLRRNTAMAGGTITLVPRNSSVHAGDTVTVDMFLNGATGVRAYQVKLNVSGGNAGSLNRDQMIIDNNRQDYIFADFGTSEVIKGEDQVNGRVGALMISGTVDINKSTYLGSQTFQVSSDAAGSFQIEVQRIDTLVADANGTPQDYQVVGATVTVN